MSSNSRSSRNNRVNRRPTAVDRMKQQIRDIKANVDPSSHRIRTPIDPPNYDANSVYNRRLRLRYTLNSSTPVTVQPTDVGSALQLGTNSTFAIDLVKVWGSTSAGQELIVILNSSGETPTFSDVGVPGHSYSAVGIRPSRQIRDTWVLASGASQPPLVTINVSAPVPSSTSTIQIIVDLVLRIRIVDVSV